MRRSSPLTILRLLADDLTGALDTAAELVPLVGPVEAFWAGGAASRLPACAAIDTGTREQGEAAARDAVRAATAGMRGAAIAFKKLDSLIRGQTLPELAACLQAGGWRHAVVAPAFPFQGRITQGGQQFAAAGGGWQAVGPALVAALAGLGLAARTGSDGPLAPGVTVFDARTDAELTALAGRLRGVEDVLWCGTGGLAQALAAARPLPVPAAVAGPVLGLFGSDQAATAAQLAACAPHWMALPHGGPEAARRVQAALARDGVALVSLDLPHGVGRAAAAMEIERHLRALINGLAAPGTLVVAGGETLRAVCLALGARSLQVQGRLIPGVPLSILRGGRWDGVAVLSKSGAFGPPTLWRDLLPLPPHPSAFERTLP